MASTLCASTRSARRHRKQLLDTIPTLLIADDLAAVIATLHSFNYDLLAISTTTRVCIVNKNQSNLAKSGIALFVIIDVKT